MERNVAALAEPDDLQGLGVVLVVAVDRGPGAIETRLGLLSTARADLGPDETAGADGLIERLTGSVLLRVVSLRLLPSF